MCQEKRCKSVQWTGSGIRSGWSLFLWSLFLEDGFLVGDRRWWTKRISLVPWDPSRPQVRVLEVGDQGYHPRSPPGFVTPTNGTRSVGTLLPPDPLCLRVSPLPWITSLVASVTRG